MICPIKILSWAFKSRFIFTCKKLSHILCEEGRIINISSVAALTGGSFGPHYGASKAGLIGLTKSSARELAKYNISVNVIAPGPIASEMTDSLNDAVMKGIIGNTPLGRLGKKSEVGELVLQLANPKIGYLTGQTIVMDGDAICNNHIRFLLYTTSFYM
ncbi:SDR family oxidoreductase [Paenibacillus polymyxa]|uniref:SDR family oxidoreductase n=1 Tax=Paenibacillus polymyxa TaxID=1406 RepID=UPI002B408E7A|nr:SDR family oxidoreductase [Paenibacillus polymyxa]